LTLLTKPITGGHNHYYENIEGTETIIDDQLPFEIPPSWSWSRLSDTAIILMGQSPVGTSVTNDKSGVEFHQGKGCFTEKELSKSEAFTSAPTKLIDFEAILMSVRAPVGDVNLVNRTICIGRGLCAIKPLIDIQSRVRHIRQCDTSSDIIFSEVAGKE